MAEKRGWRALRRAGRGVWEGGGNAHGSEGRGVGGSSATIEGGEEAAARLWGALRRRQRQCGSGGRGVGGGSAAPEGGEEAAARLWS